MSETPFFTNALGCDLTLLPDSSHTCQDVGVRHIPTVPDAYLPAWLAFEQSDQRDRISADLPLNLAPMLGTHNSYSNVFDGGSEILNLDQFFTITDQLNLGARFIRLDPVLNPEGTSIMLCHMSPFSTNFGENAVLQFLTAITGNKYPTDAPRLCATTIGSVPFAKSLEGTFSYQRPFYLAVEEIKYWLQQNPGQVVVIKVNNFYTTSEAGYVSPSDLEAIFEHAMGDMMLTGDEFRNEGSLTWPTLRQVRALGKQAIVSFASGASSDSYIWNDSSPGNSTSTPNFGAWMDADGNPVGIGRTDMSEREYIGEDRSLSNAFSSASEKGQIGWTDAALATACGYNTIALDFLYSLNHAVDDTYLGQTIDYTENGYFYAPGTDERPQWTIWSWLRNVPQPLEPEPAALVHQTLSGLDFAADVLLQANPATANLMTYRWQFMSPGSDLQFACAGPNPASFGVFPDPNNMWSYDWEITRDAGPWTNGETECQAEFGLTYHFWHPMSGPEDRALVNLMSKYGIDQVWLNHYSGNTVALPSSVTLQNGSSSEPTNIVVTSGFGGALSATFIPNGKTDFLTISQAIPGSNIFQIVPNPGLANGTYTGTLTITEQHLDGSPATQSQVPIKLLLGVTATAAQ